MNDLHLILRIARGRLVGGFFLPFLVVAGCADNDRYEFLTAPVPGPGVGADGGGLTRVELPEFGNLASADPIVGPRDDLIVGDEERILRVRGDRYEVAAWPGAGDVAGLVRDAAGVPWALGRAGTVATLENDTWVVTDRLSEGRFRHLTRDGQDRLVAVGEEGLVMRREATGWQELTPPVPADFQHSWSAPGQPLVLAGVLDDLCAVLILEDDVWRTSLLTVTGPGTLHFAAADTGTMAVGRGGRTTLHLKTGAAWSETEAPSSWQVCFWQSAQLHLGASSIWRLEGEDWVQNDLVGVYSSVAVPVAEGHLLFDSRGTSVLWSDAGETGLARGLGYVRGATADGAGTLVVLTSNGSLLRHEGGDSWRRVTCLGGECDGAGPHPYPHGLASAADGTVLVADDLSLHRLDGDALVPVPGCEYISSIFPQADGSLVIMGYDRFWHWSAGTLSQPEGSRRQFEGQARDVALHDGAVHVLTDDALFRLGRSVAQPLLAFPDQDPNLLRSDPELGLLIGGATLLAWRDGEVRDLGPRRLEEVYLTCLSGDGNGGRLVYDDESNEFLHHEAGTWTILNPPGPLPYIKETQRLVDGRYLLFAGSHAWLLQPEFPW